MALKSNGYFGMDGSTCTAGNMEVIKK